MKKVAFLLFAILLTFAVGAHADGHCSDEIGCVVLAPDDPVTIGVMSALSGPVAFLGEDSVGGVEIALNRRGGLALGREIELITEDSLCSAEGGQTAAQKIASDEQILGVVGTSCSGAAASALPVISAAGMLMISPSNTSPALTNADMDAGGLWQPGYYRTAHNDEFQGAMAAEYALNELGAASAATIHDGDPYTDGLQAVMARTFGEMGGDVVFQGAVNKGDTDMTAILTEIATNPPDVLYFPIFEPEGNFVAAQSLNVPGLEDTILMGADGLLVASFPEATGEAAIGMYLSGPYLSSEDYSAFLAEWDEEFGGAPPSGFHAHAYDAANILLNAIESVAVEQEDGSIVIGRQALRDAVSATEGYAGLTGVLTCNETGDCATGEALGMYLITEAEVTEGNWPPDVIWSKAEAAMDDM
ncbi:MAG: branched-chain amino acid ABC transporter substrate-binding protein [Anaerolineae bacterium]|nr:branched-chain amino acid ABC transporter substrate-binding protein [Anaerolineae bacterium]